ncbi:hypothetical protein BC834DRAFT_820533 [Gloeopeniophorella convolvens]|nr:hypothetical protein BC834DRAFT_820533 [Gloeopeniophorella convolvens]
MADDEDDYLSDKFLLAPCERSKPHTYADKRKEALRKSQLKNERNRTKSRRQLELESREEGLSKSLFERAEDDKASGQGQENKALSMMMKMGFKPGQALGRPAAEGVPSSPSPAPPSEPAQRTRSPSLERDSKVALSRRLVNPLPLNEWTGKKGIGLGKRAPSPTELERLAKAARHAEDADKESFRDRTRREFETRRAEARLAPAQQTCATLDERAGVEFNVLWLNPANPDTFPTGLLDVLMETAPMARGESSMGDRLRAQMRADALRPLDDDGAPADPEGAESDGAPVSPETIDEATQFLRLTPVERLERVLEYLRTEYHYCFWCGTQYGSSDEMKEECPGPDEDMHD